jgi:hypothetical protein
MLEPGDGAIPWIRLLARYTRGSNMAFGTEKRQVTPGWELKQRYHALTTCGDTRTEFPKTESAGSPCTGPGRLDRLDRQCTLALSFEM